jgi:hypothetical protein
MLRAQTQSPPQIQPSPSLKETIKWIQEKVQTNGGYKMHVDKLLNQTHDWVEFASKYTGVGSDDSGCEVDGTEVVSVKSSFGSDNWTFRQTIFLSHIRPISVKAHWWDFHLTNESSKADYTYSPSGYYILTADSVEKDSSVMNVVGDDRSNVGGDAALFRFTELNTANRVATALNHAVELCKADAKPEPF